MSKLLVLIGLPGSGKSTVARQLARRLGWRWIDSDDIIKERVGMEIRAFFEQEGEERFRDIEQEVIDELTRGERIVVGTGGGTVLREANRRVLKERATVIYLRATPDELMRRLRHDTKRPLLQVQDPMARLRELFAVRDPLYREIARFVLDTGRGSVTTTVNMILMQLELAGVVQADRGHADPDPREEHPVAAERPRVASR